VQDGCFPVQDGRPRHRHDDSLPTCGELAWENDRFDLAKGQGSATNCIAKQPQGAATSHGVALDSVIGPDRRRRVFSGADGWGSTRVSRPGAAKHLNPNSVADDTPSSAKMGVRTESGAGHGTGRGEAAGPPRIPKHLHCTAKHPGGTRKHPPCTAKLLTPPLTMPTRSAHSSMDAGDFRG
jgi:hypothetical protein